MNRVDVCNFFYECNRGNRDVERKLYFLLWGVKGRERQYLSTLTVLYRLIGQTRDMVNGKGERDLAYMQIYVWYLCYPELAIHAFIHFFYGHEHPWGSWKDINYFCDYVYRKTGNQYHPLILEACGILICQLKYDETAKYPSLAAKWCPREKKKFDWLYNIIAFYYYPRTTQHTQKSFNWTKMSLRKTIATLNRRLKTVEIDMCARNWHGITYRNIPSIAMTRYHQCFEKRAPKKTHQYKQAVLSRQTTINGRRCSMYDLIAAALKEDSEMIDLQWEEYTRQIRPLNCIPIIDMSSLVAMDPVRLYTAVGLGIIVSEKHKGDFKNRVMVFSGLPEWVSLEGLTLKAKIQKLLRKVGGESNATAPLEWIARAMKILNMEKGEIEKLQLLIVGHNMQYSEIRNIFGDMPKLAFWNMGKNDVVVCEVTQEHISVLSGYNPILLNTLFGNHRKERTVTPWHRLLKMVERYDVLDKKIRDYFS